MINDSLSIENYIERCGKIGQIHKITKGSKNPIGSSASLVREQIWFMMKTSIGKDCLNNMKYSKYFIDRIYQILYQKFIVQKAFKIWDEIMCESVRQYMLIHINNKWNSIYLKLIN